MLSLFVVTQANAILQYVHQRLIHVEHRLACLSDEALLVEMPTRVEGLTRAKCPVDMCFHNV